MEKWKDIPGYEGIYQASTLGNIRTCEGKTTFTERHGVRHWKQRVLKQKLTVNTKGRTDARIILWKGGREKTWLVARLIALTWCDGFQDGFTVNHINGNPLDNSAENLEWVSLRENIKKGFADGLYRKKQIPVMLVNEHMHFEFDSFADADRFLGHSEGYISNALKRNRPVYGVYGTQYQVLMGG